MTALTLSTIGGQVAQLRERYGTFSLRERLLVLAALMALSWMVWSLTLGTPLSAEQSTLARQNQAFDQRIAVAMALREELQAQLADNPNDRLAGERASLERRLAALEEELAAVLGSFVPPQAMPDLLEDMLMDLPELELLRLEKLPLEVLETLEDGAESSLPVLYRHPLRVELEGEYLDVLAYLQALEALPWQLSWRRLDYAVAEYPRARVLLEVETLSEQRGWLGV